MCCAAVLLSFLKGQSDDVCVVCHSHAADTGGKSLSRTGSTHCKEISIYVFLEKELRGLSSPFHIHVPVSDFYIPTIGPIFLQQNMQIDAMVGIYKSHTET